MLIDEQDSEECDPPLRFAQRLGKLRRNCSMLNRNLKGASQRKFNTSN